jgi:uncharacterized repeat protein (TIGR03803 family)
MAFAVFFFYASTAMLAQEQTFTTLFSFDYLDGANPKYMSPVQGINGHLFGTTNMGGGSGDYRPGTIFSIGVGQFQSLVTFGSSDGAYPWGGLVLGEDGTFYGTTLEGGANGYGVVFHLSSSGLDTLYSFCAQANCTDGADPFATLVLGIDGNFYGTTFSGGTGNCTNAYGHGCGTVFKITAGGKLTTLHSFAGYPSDGALPIAGLVQATDGNLYGTTIFGGAFACNNPGNYDGCGTIFRISPSGELTTIHSFNSTDGAEPFDKLVQGNDGSLYGNTNAGGDIACNPPNYGCGTVFKINSAGLTTLHVFEGGGDGCAPYAGLIQATDGNFYGTSFCGNIFQITSSGTLTTLFTFDGGILGFPGLVQATDGNFYGTTTLGGARGYGTIYRLSTGLGPFVAFVRPAGKIGQTGGILGQGFTGTTRVTLNGISASFRVVSDTYLTATVPPGATTGYVTVTTPTGTLTSNTKFVVLP